MTFKRDVTLRPIKRGKESPLLELTLNTKEQHESSGGGEGGGGGGGGGQKIIFRRNMYHKDRAINSYQVRELTRDDDGESFPQLSAP